ncbi:MAG: Gldg family protein [Desulfobacteraceae bacterium]|nr:Gldg family protein [Desulfobacteraceae bacterium]
MKGKLRAETGFKFAVYAAVVVLINLVGLTLFARFDLTENNVYSLSQASRQAVAELAEPLTIKVFFTQDLPAPHNNTRRYLRDLLAEYAVYSNENFNYRFHNVSPEGQGLGGSSEKNRKLAESYGIHPVQIRSVEQDEVKFKNAYMGLALIHGDLVEKIPAVTSTDRLEYKITTAIEKMGNKVSALAGLEEKIRVRLIMSSTLKDIAQQIGTPKLADLPGNVKKAVSELDRKNYGKLTYEYIDPETGGKDLAALTRKYDLLTLKWPDIAEAGISAGRGGIGLALDYGEKTRTIQVMNSYRVPMLGSQYELMDMRSLKDAINENIETLIGVNQDLGYLADHGTLELFSRRRSQMNQQQRQTLGNFHKLVSQTYTIKQVNLSDEPIPEGLNCLVIAEPTKSFTDYELYKIDQALMRGTNLAIFTPGLKQAKSPKKTQAMRSPASYAPMDTGLEKLLAHYGIRVKPAYVMDKNCYEQKMPRRLGGGQQPVYYAPIIKNKNINHAPAFMKNIKGVVTLENSPVQIKQNIAEKNDLSARPLFSSSAQSWLVKENIQLNPMMIQPPEAEEKYGSHDLACLVEGRFPSYFAGKEIPAKKSGDKTREKEQKSGGPEARDAPAEKAPAEEAGGESGNGTQASAIQAENRFMARGNPAKVLLVGSSGILTDNVIDSKGKSPNAAFVMNAIDGLNGRSEIAVLRSKTQQFNPLEETSPAVRSLVRTGNIAGLPVLVALCGLLVWWRRSRRRKRIRKMFAEQPKT